MPSNSKFDSNIHADSGDESIAGFLEISATTLIGNVTGNVAGNLVGASVIATTLVGALTGNVTGNVTGNLVGASVKATSFVKIGAGSGCKYLFAGAETVQASIVIAGQALADVSASLEGSVYYAKDNIWIFTSTMLATPITAP